MRRRRTKPRSPGGRSKSERERGNSERAGGPPCPILVVAGTLVAATGKCRARRARRAGRNAPRARWDRGTRSAGPGVTGFQEAGRASPSSCDVSSDNENTTKKPNKKKKVTSPTRRSCFSKKSPHAAETRNHTHSINRNNRNENLGCRTIKPSEKRGREAVSSSHNASRPPPHDTSTRRVADRLPPLPAASCGSCQTLSPPLTPTFSLPRPWGEYWVVL